MYRDDAWFQLVKSRVVLFRKWDIIFLLGMD